MKRVLFFLVCFLVVSEMQAQKISCQYNNVSLSEVLRQLNEQTKEYTISFLYNDLEDFLITASIHRKPVPDAIRQVIGFYPVRMLIEGKEIVVECLQKTKSRYKGHVVDNQGHAVGYATIALLSPADSTLLNGGISNDNGYFVVPCEQTPVIARVSYVGYKTVYKLCTNKNIGTICLKPETYTIKGVKVVGERQIVRAENGKLTYNVPQLLEIMPADNAYDALTRIPGVSELNGSIMFSGQTVTLIINGKPTTLSSEKVVERLKQMPATVLAKAEVMPSAPARYHVRGMAINIVTKDFSGTDKFVGQAMLGWQQGKYGEGYFCPSVIYNRGKISIDASYTYTNGTGYGQVEHNAAHPLGNERVAYVDKTSNRSYGINHDYRIGFDYSFSETHNLSFAYTGQWNSTHSTNTTTGTAHSTQNSHQHDYLHNVDASYATPFGLQIGVSYTNYQNPRTQTLVGELSEVSRNLFVDSRQKVGKWLITVNQANTLPKGWQLSYGGKAQFASNNSYQTTLDEKQQPIDDASSHVDYGERILNFYVGTNKQVGKSISIDASVTAEQYHAPKWNEWRIYPQFNAMWNINTANMLNVSLSSEAVYPDYWSTMSSIYYSSAYSEIWGNPGLKPMSKYDINLMWQYRQKYTFTAFAMFEPDYFVQLAYQPSDRMTVIMKETNFDYSKYFGLQASAQFRIGSWLNGNIMATALYRHDKSDLFFDLPFDRTCVTGIFGGMAAAKLSSKHSIQLIFNPFLQTKAIQGVYDIAPLFRLNATLRYSSPSGKWSIVAQGHNIFNVHFSTRSTISNQNYEMRVWMPYTSYSLTAIYRVGNFEEKKKKAVDTSRMGY